MTRLYAVLLPAVLLAAPLGACSKGELIEVPLEPTRAVDGTEEEVQWAYAKARYLCNKEARAKGISSVTRIVLLRGKVSESDYIECMESKGFVEPKE